jgi:hypothetical protein
VTSIAVIDFVLGGGAYPATGRTVLQKRIILPVLVSARGVCTVTKLGCGLELYSTHVVCRNVF